jgi:hypothetical protein
LVPRGGQATRNSLETDQVVERPDEREREARLPKGSCGVSVRAGAASINCGVSPRAQRDVIDLDTALCQ